MFRATLAIDYLRFSGLYLNIIMDLPNMEEVCMASRAGNSLGPLEYFLIIILILMILFTVLSIFWPAIQLFYQNTFAS